MRLSRIHVNAVIDSNGSYVIKGENDPRQRFCVLRDTDNNVTTPLADIKTAKPFVACPVTIGEWHCRTFTCCEHFCLTDKKMAVGKCDCEHGTSLEAPWFCICPCACPAKTLRLNGDTERSDSSKIWRTGPTPLTSYSTV